MRLMKPLLLLFAISFSFSSPCQNHETLKNANTVDPVQSLKDTLAALAGRSDNPFFRMHCNSITAVMREYPNMNANDTDFIATTLHAFNNVGDASAIRYLSPYLSRKRPFIISWRSPTDGAVSFSWLTLPKNWDPSKKYPLYVMLHGLWSVATDPLEYMTYPYRVNASTSQSFEDGYLLSPWGRGNYWYLGISETDIWESIHALESVALIEPSRRYLAGHSMGGYGAWNIAYKTADFWAALGIYAGALWYYPYLLTEEVADSLNRLPTYFVCGTLDNLMEYNMTAYELLENAGNWHVQFVTFDGGHEYTETNVMNMYLWMRQRVNQDLVSSLDHHAGKGCWALHAECFPNPVSGQATIKISGNETSPVSAILFDLAGNQVREVASRIRLPGEKYIPFDAEGLSPGMYILKITAESASCELKLTIP